MGKENEPNVDTRDLGLASNSCPFPKAPKAGSSQCQSLCIVLSIPGTLESTEKVHID